MGISKKTYYEDKVDAKYMPLGLASFGKLTIEQPIIMAIYCGMVERFGLDNLQLLKQLTESCSVFSALQVKQITYRSDIDAYNQNLETTMGAYDKQLSLLGSKKDELEKLVDVFTQCYKDDSDSGMLVNADRINLKLKEIQRDISDKQDLALEKEKFEFQIRKSRGDVDVTTQKIEKYAVQFKKLLDLYTVRNVEPIERFAVGDEKEVDKIILCGVSTTNELFREKLHSLLKVDDVKHKTKPFIKFVQGYFKCMLVMIDFVAQLIKRGSENLSKENLMTIKKLETTCKCYQQHLVDDKGMKFVYYNLPAVLTARYFKAFKLYLKEIEVSLSDKPNGDLLKIRREVLDLAQKNGDPFITSVATAVDDLCTKNFNIGHISISNNEEAEEVEENDEMIEQNQSAIDDTNDEIENDIAEGEDATSNNEQVINDVAENTLQEINSENAMNNAPGEGGNIQIDPLTGMPVEGAQMPQFDPNMMMDPTMAGGMMTNIMVDPNTGMPIDPSQMQQFDPNMMVDPNTGMPVDPSQMQQFDPNMGMIDPNTGMPFNPTGF